MSPNNHKQTDILYSAKKTADMVLYKTQVTHSETVLDHVFKYR